MLPKRLAFSLVGGASPATLVAVALLLGAPAVALAAPDAPSAGATPRAPSPGRRSCSRRPPYLAQSAVDKEPSPADEPGKCTPRCRKGFYCKAGKCLSLCNPRCRSNERCTESGECTPVVLRGDPTRYNYFGVFAGARAGVSKPAFGTGDVRIEIGGKYIAFQMGPGFSSKVTALRAMLQAHIPFQPKSGLPLYLVPTFGLGYVYNWVDDPPETRMQDLLIAVGMRLRYDPIPRMALFLNVLQVDIGYLRLVSDNQRDIERSTDIPVNWNFSFGAAFLY